MVRVLASLLILVGLASSQIDSAPVSIAGEAPVSIAGEIDEYFDYYYDYYDDTFGYDYDEFGEVDIGSFAKTSSITSALRMKCVDSVTGEFCKPVPAPKERRLLFGPQPKPTCVCPRKESSP